MIATGARQVARRWRAVEVVQASVMDCGPAALASLLQGHGIPADCGRLREACQTDVDGTSIDAIEGVMNLLGLAAEQVMLPADRLFGGPSPSLPALAVTQMADGAAHFVVVWRRIGPFLQIMDPAEGRRWTTRRAFVSRLLTHKMSVAAEDWLSWARGAENRAAGIAGLQAIGLPPTEAQDHVDRAAAAQLWFAFAATEACTRLTQRLLAEGALDRRAAAAFFRAVLQETLGAEDDIYRLVPPQFWSVAPDPSSPAGERRLILRGAVLVRILGRQPAETRLSPELSAAVQRSGVSALGRLWPLLRAEGWVLPLVLVAGTLLAVLGATFEAIFFRSLMAPGASTPLAVGLVALMAGLFFLRMTLGSEVLRLGRHVEARLRMAFLTKLPRLSDRYHESRPLSDMADRAQSLHQSRNLPGMALHLVQAVAELVLVSVGLCVLMPGQVPLILMIDLVAVTLQLLATPLYAEAELSQRSRGAAVAGVALDALRGQAALRAHRGEKVLRQRHDALLAGWLGAGRQLSDLTAALAALRQGLVLGLVGWLILGQGGNPDLLVLWWALKLPETGSDLAGLIRQIPAQRALLLRLSEPLGSPERPMAAPGFARRLGPGAFGLSIRNGGVVAAGREVLSNVDLDVAPGEHLAIVGPSGSGKSSLIGVMLGWHRLASGELRLNGLPASEGELAALRARIAWVDPSVLLWQASLRENLEFAAPGAETEAIARSLEAAELDRLVALLPGGIAAPCGAGGGLLSGGEGQRLRLARAFLQQDVGLALLDEPFRGLDRAMRLRLLRQSRQHWAGSTLLWVTHDLAEVADFPRVLVLDGGRIVEDGVPARLLAQDSRFAALSRAEAEVKEKLWGAGDWRHLWMENGHVHDLV